MNIMENHVRIAIKIFYEDIVEKIEEHCCLG